MSAALLTVGLFVAAFTVEVFGGGDHVDVTDVLWFASFMAFPLVGLLILWHVPGNVVGWLFIAVGAAQTSGVLLGTVSNILRDRDPSSVAGAELFVWENICLGVAWVLATTYPLFLFPDGRLPSPRWRWVTRATTALLVVAVVALLLKPGRVEEDDPALNPLGVAQLGMLPTRLLDIILAGLGVVTLLGIASLIVRWRRGSDETRKGMSWLVLALLTAVIVVVVEGVLSPWLPDWAGAIAETAAVLALPVATAVAVLRSRLFDVQAVLDRALVYVLLVGLVVLVYVVIVDVTARLLGAGSGVGSSLLAATVIAVVLSPAKEFLQSLDHPHAVRRPLPPLHRAVGARGPARGDHGRGRPDRHGDRHDRPLAACALCQGRRGTRPSPPRATRLPFPWCHTAVTRVTCSSAAGPEGEPSTPARCSCSATWPARWPSRRE